MGELARKPGCPKLADTPLELLTLRPGEGFSKLENLGYALGGAVASVSTSLVINYLWKRPWFASMPRHAVFGVVGFFAANFLVDVGMADRSEIDAVLKHYISLHPEDFPPYERKRWGEVYVRFQPKR